MRKLSAALLFPAALMTGCSMAGTGDYMTDTYAPLQKAQYGCGGDCGDAYPVAQKGYQNTDYGQQVQLPDTHVYGQNVQAPHNRGAYVAPTYAAAPNGLRGKHKLKEPYTYGNLGGVMYDVDSELYGVQGRLGYQSALPFGAEVEGSFGLTDETTDITGPIGAATLDQKIDYQLAAFAVGRLPVLEKVNLLGRLGYHTTELSETETDTLGSFDRSYSTDGLAYGVGAEYALSPRTSIRADYTVYDFDGPDADAVSLSVARKF